MPAAAASADGLDPGSVSPLTGSGSTFGKLKLNESSPENIDAGKGCLVGIGCPERGAGGKPTRVDP